MKIYDYIMKTEKIEVYDPNRVNAARFIVDTGFTDEFIVPNTKKFLFMKSLVKKYMRDNLKKDPRLYYIFPTMFSCGIHCTYVEKTRLSEIIKALNVLDLIWVSPYYFALEVLEESGYENGRLYVNIGEYIYRMEVNYGKVVSYHCHLKEGYFSKDMRKVDFYKKSIIWIKEGEDGLT